MFVSSLILFQRLLWLHIWVLGSVAYECACTLGRSMETMTSAQLAVSLWSLYLMAPLHTCVLKHGYGGNTPCSEKIAQSGRCAFPLTLSHTHNVRSVTLGYIGQSWVHLTAKWKIFLWVCLIMSGVKHNVWPTAWQILAEALDPDHTHAGSENNSMRTHPHKHTDYTHAHVTVWEEHFSLCLTLLILLSIVFPSFFPSLLVSDLTLLFHAHL